MEKASTQTVSGAPAQTTDPGAVKLQLFSLYNSTKINFGKLYIACCFTANHLHIFSIIPNTCMLPTATVEYSSWTRDILKTDQFFSTRTNHHVCRFYERFRVGFYRRLH